MATQPFPYVTPEQYLEYDRASEFRSEYLFGEIIPFARGTPNRSLLIANTLRELGIRLRGTASRVFDCHLRVALDSKKGIVYPDVTVVCGQLEYLDAKKDTVTNPKIAVEILSPSTVDRDLGSKARLYWDVPSMTDLLFIEQNRISIEYWSRLPNGKWDRTHLKNRDLIIKLESVNCEIPVSEIYDGVELPLSEVAQ